MERINWDMLVADSGLGLLLVECLALDRMRLMDIAIMGFIHFLLIFAVEIS